MNKGAPPRRRDAFFFLYYVRFAGLVANADAAPALTIVGPDPLAHDATAAVGIGAAVIRAIGVTRE
jgi:hypothetical protein